MKQEKIKKASIIMYIAIKEVARAFKELVISTKRTVKEMSDLGVLFEDERKKKI